MEKDRTIPLTAIGEHFNIRLGSFPPHRNQLLVEAKTLDRALKTLDLKETRIILSYQRNEPKTIVVANLPSEETAVPLTVEAEHEKQQKRKPLIFDPTGQKKVYITLSYKDRQTQTPASTAKHLSQELGKVLANYKLNKYIFELMNLSLANSDVKKEIAFAKYFLTAGSSYSAGAAAVFEFGDRLAGTDYANYIQFFSGVYLLSYLGLACVLTYGGLQYRKGNSKSGVDRFYGEDLRRPFYPAVLINNYLVPSFIYSINALSANDIIVPKSE